jgi:voltage-gated potassium channel
MDSLKETRRQIVIALDAVAIVLTIGVIGFMTIEHMSLLDAIWVTITTLTTIGYGDVIAKTVPGRIFTLILILSGLSVFAYGLQAGATFIVSPAIRDLRQRRRTQAAIENLRNHYIICGAGEMVDKTIKYLIEGAKLRQAVQLENIYRPVDHFLDRIFGDDAHGHYPRMRAVLRRIFLFFVWEAHRTETLLDVVVVVTPSAAFAAHLRNNGLLVLEGDPSNDDLLRRAGVEHAQAMMMMLDSDTETLLSVLTARSLNPQVDITATALEEEIAPKMIRVGANGVIAPYEVAGQFLNNATLRPAVNDFFGRILFSEKTDMRTSQIYLWDDSPWIGQRLGHLKLREAFQAGVIGLRQDSGEFIYAPSNTYILKENEILIAVAPTRYINALQQASRSGIQNHARPMSWQRLPLPAMLPRASRFGYTLDEAEAATAMMSGHFIICGSGRVARNAVSKLNPERPFVIVSDDEGYTQEMLERGFRLVQGNPVHENVLRKAGVDRAQAIMVAIDDPAISVITVVNCRSLSKRLLITATAPTDDMIPKLYRAGADRVLGPFQVAAQFVLLATTRPVVSDFMQYVLFNYHVGIETTELYMQNDSPWIGSSIESLRLDHLFRAGVIGIRQSGGDFIYAPPTSYILQAYDVLIVVTPMEHSDELRTTAHGSATKRPHSLRHGYVEAAP